MYNKEEWGPWLTKVNSEIRVLERSFDKAFEDTTLAQRDAVQDAVKSSDMFNALFRKDSSAITEIIMSAFRGVPTEAVMEIAATSYQEGIDAATSQRTGIQPGPNRPRSLSKQQEAIDEYNNTTERALMAVAASDLLEDGEDHDITAKVFVMGLLVAAVFRRLTRGRRGLIEDVVVLGSYNAGLYDSAIALAMTEPIPVRDQANTGVDAGSVVVVGDSDHTMPGPGAGSGSLYKLWISLKDGRVRQAHVFLDGMSAPVLQPFHVNGKDIRFPKDPLAPLSLTARCRCTLGFYRA